MPVGGGAVTTLYSNISPCCVNGLTRIGTNLFWIDPNGDTNTATAIFRVPARTGGSAVKIYSGYATGEPIVDGASITTDGVKLYTADEVNGRVHSLNADASSIFQLGPERYSGYFANEHFNSIAVSGGTVYVADSGKAGVDSPQVVTIPAAGGASFTSLFVGAPFVQPSGITVGNGKIYVADPGAENTIWQMPVTGGTPTALVCGAPFAQISGLVFLNNALYVTDSGASAIYKVDLAVRLQTTRVTSSGLQFRLTGPAGNYVIQASTNLVNWISLATTNAPNGVLDFTDTTATGLNRRFYRALLQ